MYATCIVCAASLGSNEAIERFPVGRRLAFDAVRGFLWAVCDRCERWNLVPIEERWEAIEDCERRFRDTRVRVSTDNIGLARLRDGTDLVRVGRPLRPEMAAWRYGDQFGRRRRRSLIRGGIVGAALAGGAVAIPLLGVPLALIGALGASLLPVAALAGIAASSGPAALRAHWLRDNEGQYLLVVGTDLANVRLASTGDGAWALHVAHAGRWDSPKQWRESLGIRAIAAQPSYGTEEARVSGEAGLTIARALLPLLNGAGAKRDTVQQAVGALSQLGTGGDAFRSAAARVREYGARQTTGDTGALAHLPREVKLALEMAAFEDQERLALEGELAALEAAWRDAEEIAGIADQLLEPPGIAVALGRLKRG